MNRLRFISLLLSVVIVLPFFTSCSKTDGSFPVIERPDSSVSETISNSDENTSDVNEDLVEISVALPYSDLTVQRLFKLYYCKLNDLFLIDQTGADISLDYLDAIDTPWIINTVSIPSEGADISSATSWQDMNSVPDIILVNSISEYIDSGIAVPLNDYLYDNDYISANNINHNAMLSVMNDGDIYAVPHYFSVMLIAGNSDYVPNDERISFRPDLNEFSNYLNLIRDTYDSDDFIVFTRAYELVPYLTSTFNNDTYTSFMFSSEFNNDDSYDYQLDSLLNFVSNLYADDISCDSDSNGADPRIARDTALWLTSSADISYWEDYYPSNMYYSMIPSMDSSTDANIYAELFSLCISSNSTNKDFAADFAAFISLDPDAQLLIGRLESQTGFLPVINNSNVWNMVNSDTVFGTESMVIEQYFDNLIICPSSGTSEYQSIAEYNSSYIDSVIDNDTSVEYLLEEALND